MAWLAYPTHGVPPLPGFGFENQYQPPVRARTATAPRLRWLALGRGRHLPPPGSQPAPGSPAPPPNRRVATAHLSARALPAESKYVGCWPRSDRAPSGEAHRQSRRPIRREAMDRPVAAIAAK
jgi:hypothetical protein